jgi:hyperosmotically inducible protein
MKTLKASLMFLAVLGFGILSGCSANSTQSPDISSSLRKALDQAGLKDVSATQDRDKGVVTLSGHVAADADKQQAQSVAQAIAGNQVVANQIAVIPVGGEKDAKAVNADLDSGIEKNLDAVLILNKLHDNVKYTVKNNVITLTGEVNSEPLRAQAQQIAAGVPNVQQVVNELQVKNQKATSSQ